MSAHFRTSAPPHLVSLWAMLWMIASLLASPAGAQSGLIASDCGMPDEPAGTVPGTVPGATPGSEAQRWIPTEGRVHALVVFVQGQSDTFRACIDTQAYALGAPADRSAEFDLYCGPGDAGNRYQSETEDPATEWPAFRIVGGDTVQTRPDWADRFIDAPGTNPASYQTGSLSHFFWEMSRGALRYEGHVYPHLVSTVAKPDSLGDNLAMTLEVLQQLRADPAGLDFRQFDRYDNLTGQFTPDEDGDGEPDGDGIFDQLLIVGRLGQGVARLGFRASLPTPPTGSGYYDANDVFFLSGAGRQFLGGVRVMADRNFGGSGRTTSGSISNGETLDRAVAVTAHEIGHFMIALKHPCDGNNVLDAQDRLSLMCGPRQRSMNAPDRYRLGWLMPHFLDASAAATQTLALDPSPTAGDAVWITNGPAAGVGDVLVEARTHASTWDGPPPLADGDFADFAPIPEQGLLVYQIGPPATTPYLASGRYASMDNSGAQWRRQIAFDQLARRALTGAPGPRLGYAAGDAFTPFSRMRFGFHQGPMDARLALTDIAVGPGAVTATLHRDFLSSTAARTVTTNYTLDATSRARSDQWTGARAFGGHLRFEPEPESGNLPTPPPTASFSVLGGGTLELAGAHSSLAGTTTRPLPLTFGDGAQMVVSGGHLDTDLVTFGPAPGADGWSGIRFVGNARSVLSRTEIAGVDPGTTGARIPGAISVYAGVVELDRTTVGGNATAGVYVSGSGARVETSGETETAPTQIRDNDGYGVVVAGDGTAILHTGTLVTVNTSGGAHASGKGAVVALDGAEIVQNGGPGVTGAAGGEVQTVGVPSVVGQNRGGLFATNGGAVFAGLCTAYGCSHDPSNFPLNYDATRPETFDARAALGSVVLAEGNQWGEIEDEADLVLLRDKSSYLSVTPVIAPAGFRAAPLPSARAPGGAAPVASRVAAAPLFALASRHLAAGDTLAAGDAVLGALAGAETGDDRRAAYEAAARLFALARPAALLAVVEDAALTAPGDTASAHPWALRALVVARAEAGADAETPAGALASFYAGTEHGLWGQAALVSLAVARGDEGAATARLAGLAALAPEAETTAAAAALVAAAYPSADVGGAFRGAAGKGGPGVTSGLAAADGGSAGEVSVGAVRPNPSAGTAALALTLPRAAHVEAAVYDALGRRVAVLVAGEQAAGARDLAIPALPSGTDLVRVVVREAGAAALVEVRRLTTVR